MGDERMLFLVLVRSHGRIAKLVRFFLRCWFGDAYGQYDHIAIFDAANHYVYDFDRPGLRSIELNEYRKQREVVAISTIRKAITLEELAAALSNLQTRKYSDLYNLNLLIRGIWPWGFNCVRACCTIFGRGDIYAPPGEEAFK